MYLDIIILLPRKQKKLLTFLTKGHVKKQGGYLNLILEAVRGLNKAVYNWAEILMKSKLSLSFGNKLMKRKCPNLLNMMLPFLKLGGQFDFTVLDFKVIYHIKFEHPAVNSQNGLRG